MRFFFASVVAWGETFSQHRLPPHWIMLNIHSHFVYCTFEIFSTSWIQLSIHSFSICILYIWNLFDQLNSIRYIHSQFVYCTFKLFSTGWIQLGTFILILYIVHLKCYQIHQVKLDWIVIPLILFFQLRLSKSVRWPISNISTVLSGVADRDRTDRSLFRFGWLHNIVVVIVVVVDQLHPAPCVSFMISAYCFVFPGVFERQIIILGVLYSSDDEIVYNLSLTPNNNIDYWFIAVFSICKTGSNLSRIIIKH